MMDVRWSIILLGATLLLISGCGGGGAPSASRAYDNFIAAVTALEAGDKDAAFDELSASIEKSPTDWAYFERARIYLERGQEQEAIADCQKGLELNPKYANLVWLSAELKKPVAQRFKGRFANPPTPK
jgi:tetratricopeptide (TPR) repeat protein